VGNRLADFQANRSRTAPDRPAPRYLRELPLHHCEQYLTVRNKHHLHIIDDVRRTSVLTLRESALEHWLNRSGDQAYFASAGMMQLGRAVLRCGTAALQSAVVHVATNSIEYVWVEDGHAYGASALHQLVCGGTSHTLSLSHLFTCTCLHASCITYQQKLRAGLLALLQSCADTAGWLRLHSAKTARAMLCTLFPPSLLSHVHDERHYDTIQCGAFTSTQASQAVRLLSIQDREEGLGLMLQLRLLCLEQVHNFYSERKQSLPPPAAT
jgi:hypothetical protein